MGEAAGRKGVWAYVKGGMGKISESIACAARDAGAEIVCNARVDEILGQAVIKKRRSSNG